jgi:hypothetical protein
MRIITLVNQSRMFAPADLATAVAALQIQLDQHVAPAWGQTAQLATDTSPQVGREEIALVDSETQADALGWHTETAQLVPQGIIQVAYTIANGDKWQSTLSHEVVEQLLNPWVDRYVIAPWLGRTAVLPQEGADAVEGDEYEINGVPVSNFVLPAWFQAWAPVGAQVDYLNTLKGRPLTMSPGGYMSYSYTMRTWSQSFAEKCPLHQRVAQKHSRRARIMQKAQRAAA